jgi:glutathione S-transferase
MSCVLVHLPISVWSERARWVLDYHRVPHRRVEHLPMLFELPLRVATRDLRTPITVPILFDEGLVLRDSLSIARHVDRIGHNAPLFDEASLAAVLAWNDVADRLAAAGRARAMDRLIASPEALAEQVPAPLSALGGAMRPVARLGAEFVASKHRTRAMTRAESEAQMVSALEALASAIERGAPLVGERFGYADVACATSLDFVLPRSSAPMGPATREAFTESTLATRYAKVLAWRDEVYERHRGGPPSR